MTSRLGSRGGTRAEGSAFQKGRHPVSHKATRSPWCHRCWDSMDAPSVALNPPFILPAREPAVHGAVADAPFKSSVLFLIVFKNNLNDQDHPGPLPPPSPANGWWHNPSPLASMAGMTNQSQHILLLGPGDPLPNLSQHRALDRPC